MGASENKRVIILLHDGSAISGLTPIKFGETKIYFDDFEKGRIVEKELLISKVSEIYY